MLADVRQQAEAQRGAMPPGGGGGMMSRLRNQVQAQQQFRKPVGYDPRGGPIAPPPGKGGGGMPGGPMVPPNFRGQMQRQRMMNRPRRGVPGPAGAGGHRIVWGCRISRVDLHVPFKKARVVRQCHVGQRSFVRDPATFALVVLPFVEEPTVCAVHPHSASKLMNASGA